MVLTNLSMHSGLRRRFNSVSTRSNYRVSMLQARDSFSCTHASTRRFSSSNIKFWVGPLLPFAMTLLLTLTAVACTGRCGIFHFP